MVPKWIQRKYISHGELPMDVLFDWQLQVEALCAAMSDAILADILPEQCWFFQKNSRISFM